MNIFYLDKECDTNAEYHVDKHVVKMPVEYCQMLSTAHRVLDGKAVITKSDTGRKKTEWHLDDETLNKELYKATHINHPCAVWVRQSSENYRYLFTLLCSLLSEYTLRYNKVHACDKKLAYLFKHPENIQCDLDFIEPPKCMPEDCQVDSVVESYRNFYKKYKSHILNWKHGEIPEWI
jgi:hypothetical protein